MDHLDLPRHIVRPLPPVIMYAEQDYDGGPFLEYLNRIDWTEEDLTAWNTPKTSQEIHSVLQTWTYFGILSTILGESFTQSEFRRNEGGTAFVWTGTLKSRVREWVDRESRLPQARRHADEEHMKACMDKMWHIYGLLNHSSEKRAAENRTIDSILCLSAQVLYDELIRAHKWAFHPPDQEILDFWQIKILVFPVANAFNHLFETMLADGWCEAELHSMRKLGPGELCFAFCLGRPGPDKDHSRCSETRCVAYQTSEDHYRTRHVETECRCEYVHASQDEVAGILQDESGSIPLITHFEPERRDDGKLWVTMIPSKLGMDEDSTSGNEHDKFVAISHVWSDGLGNNRDNSIPLCQFQRLSRLVLSLYPDDASTQVPFWFDTLCFPLRPQEAYDTALIRMRESYEEADKVLVLDKYLLSAPAAGASDWELMMRIYCSPWNRRLWTLQEGVLARDLIFQFADEHVSGTRFVKKMQHWLRILELATLEGHLGIRGHRNFSELIDQTRFERCFTTLLDLRERESNMSGEEPPNAVENFLGASGPSPGPIRRPARDMGVDEVKMAVTYRTTSNAEDEPLCLGNLLGVDPAAVVHARTREARMRVIWEAVLARGGGHAALIFAGGPKLVSQPGYRWAPLSLMDGQPLEFFGGLTQSFEQAEHRGMDGLMVNIPGILLHTENVGVKEMFSVLSEAGNRYCVSWYKSDETYMRPLCEGEEIKSSVGSCFALLMMSEVEKDGKPTFPLGLGPGMCWLADVVRMDQKEQIFYVQLLASVGLIRWSEILSMGRPKEFHQRTQDRWGAVDARTVDATFYRELKFCVD